MSPPSPFHNLKPCRDPPKPDSVNPRIDRWIGSASASNRCNLDMCTEALGFENGAMCFIRESETDAETKKTLPEKQRSSATMEFPPPLTTLGGEGRMVLRRKSEGGRVLLVGFRPSVTEAERGGGRLLLRIPARENLRESEEEDEEQERGEGGGERGEEEGLVLSNGCGGKCRKAAALFSSDAFFLAAT